MESSTKWVAVDWGTSNLRAWVHGPQNAIVASCSSSQGMGALSSDQFEAALLDLVGEYLTDDATPVVCCGMVGARQGWAEAPYATTPCSPVVVEQSVRPIVRDPRLSIRILPGIKQTQPADVMRGEETQVAGYLARYPDFDGVVCLPGTHTKWAHVSAGEIVSFQTFLTGELFALLSQGSVLRHSLVGDGWDQDAFGSAVADAQTSPGKLSARLFGLRAESLLNDMSPSCARATLSGLLIGIELVGARPYWLGQEIVIVGAENLSALYEAALVAQGVEVSRISGDNMTLVGLTAAYEKMKETFA